MVCAKCEKKLAKLATPDVYRSTTGEQHKDRKDVGVNKLIKKQDKSTHVCKSCKNSVMNQNKYCNYCAYKKGKCARCGKKVIDTSSHNMSAV
ncbi:conserved hypothetical protein [Perkinsus marinus ATCC 50983]|uniref:Cysteine-rich PDZ-binding protein n=1 Tax=Perkinsus marinus (strain ATCC 50983 / TXsc) TaxID=423536 RepID=C5LKQ4_PERM5|nr:conserved hypothetical protein [Perkinsus marinus ATCC 50983]EER02689.1 conserved hypothetical protein [Perkinsus marinus ATCC 50983]|eukprot:XP_002770285.1 conserved hypothetical protein [Perkinsus marinus ATCC 50983]